MSWLYSRVLVEEYLGGTCSDGEPSAPLNGNPIQLAYCAPDKMTKFSRLSRFGMTYKPLTENRGQELLTLYLEAFRAKTSQQPVKEPELTENDPECGRIWRELLARYDPATSLWKTPQCSLLGDYTEFLETWPRWGLMQDGASYQQQTLAHHTKETGSGLLPTPLASLGTNGGPNQRDSNGRPGLQMAAMTWPTPIAQDAKHSGYAQSGPGKADKLAYAVVRWPTPVTKGLDGGSNSRKAAQAREMWPTPVTSDHNSRRPTETWKGSDLPSQVWIANGGTENPDKPAAKLNPTWVEWLMGWPLGWTDLKPLETGRFRSWQQQHGGS